MREHVLTGDFATQNDHDQNQTNRQIEVLRAHAEAERQTVAQNADNQRASTVPMMLPLPPVFSVPPSTTAVMMASV